MIKRLKYQEKYAIFLFQCILAILIATLPLITIQTDSSLLNSDYDYYELAKKRILIDSDVPSDFMDSIEITHHGSLAQEGLNLFQGRLSDESGVSLGNYLLVLDMEGNVKYSVRSNYRFKTPKFINSSTIMYMFAGDIQLRNLETNATETLPIPEGHHDIEYNPFTDTFLTLQQQQIGTYDDLPIWYDNIVEYDRNGNQLWLWNSSKNIPFNPDQFLNEIWSGGQDWTHGNTIFWLVEEDIIYYNPRNLDTFYKIDKQTGEIIWSLGRVGDFTLYNKHGKERTTLWWHSHALEMIGPNRFILFDNDNQNQTNLFNHRSRLVEILVDEEAMTATEVWSWTSPEDYFCGPWGDADRLPNGNTIGTFGAGFSQPTYLTEVTPKGRIAWEIKFDHLPEIRTNIYQSERYFKKPLIKITKILNQTSETGNVTIDLSVWNTYRTRYHSKAIVKVLAGEDLLHERSFEFLPHWQETTLSLEVPIPVNSSNNDVKVLVENSDGKTAELNLSISVENTTTSENSRSTGTVTSSGFIITTLGFIIISVILLSRRKKRE